MNNIKKNKYCISCGILIKKKYPSRLKHAKYCSSSCFAKTRVGKKNPFYGKKHSKKTRKKIKEKTLKQFKEKGHPSWKGGITKINYIIRELPENDNWKKVILIRDNYTCQQCFQIGGKLHIHHIKQFAKILKKNNIITKKEAKKCEELWDTENGITLCKDCYSIIHHSIEENNNNIIFKKPFKTKKSFIFMRQNIRIGKNTILGKNTKIFSNVIINDGVNLGKNCMVGNFSLIRENSKIGNNNKIGSHVKIEWECKIGDNNNIQGFNTIGETAKIGNNNFIGPYVTIPGENEMGGQKGKYIPYPSKITDNCKIGSSSIILPGHIIGKGAVIGAGSVITKNVGPGELWYGKGAEKQK